MRGRSSWGHAGSSRRSRGSCLRLPDYDETAFNISAGVVWKFADEHAFAVNVTRTERHPQAAELYANGPHIAAQRFEVGDPNLDLEKAITTDVSLRRSGEGVQWTLSAFYNDYSDYIFANPTGEIEDDLPMLAYLQNGARVARYQHPPEVRVAPFFRRRPASDGQPQVFRSLIQVNFYPRQRRRNGIEPQRQNSPPP